jgi:hypothetical protein
MGKSVFAALERNDLAGRCIRISYREIAGLNHRTKRNGWKIGRRSRVAMRRRDEADHLRAHANPSHTAIATRPSSAREIRYAVIHLLFSFQKSMRGMIVDDAIISGANPIPREWRGRGRARGARRRPARSRAPAMLLAIERMIRKSGYRFFRDDHDQLR